MIKNILKLFKVMLLFIQYIYYELDVKIHNSLIEIEFELKDDIFRLKYNSKK